MESAFLILQGQTAFVHGCGDFDDFDSNPGGEGPVGLDECGLFLLHVVLCNMMNLETCQI